MSKFAGQMLTTRGVAAFWLLWCAAFVLMLWAVSPGRTLQDALAAPLPGASAHERMSPQPRRPWPTGFDSARLRHAAGLVLIFRHDDRAHLILTVRTDRLGRHGGQVSLPGGVVDPGETIEQAALREAQEEIGLGETGVRALGTLTPVDIPVSGFRLHPVVAAATGRPALRPSDVSTGRACASRSAPTASRAPRI